MTTIEQPERLDLRSHDIAGDRLTGLLELFPEARTEDGQIDFDQLKRALGEAVDPGKERYGLTWPGKADCFKTIQTPSLGTLLPAPEESVNWDTTENLIIEGDNLEVLKLLQKSYLGKVKMIYIDPPYNTGNDFIYPDDYAESLKTYLEYTGQVDAEGRRFSTNTDTDGRFHSKWLNMLYPRLYLARNLLRDDGVIFISINDVEVRNLRALCDDIFGEENFVETFTIRSNPRGNQAKKLTASEHELVLCYARQIAELPPLASGLTEEQKGEYRHMDGRGRYRELGLRKRGAASRREDAPNQFYPIYVDPVTRTISVTKPADHQHVSVLPKLSDGADGRWRWSRESVAAKSDSLNAREVRGADGTRWDIFEKNYLTEDTARKIRSILSGKEFNYENATEELRELFGEKLYDYPKPVALISHLLQNTSDGQDDIVLDFFAGSGTTAHAVLDLNAGDGGNRKFVLVQLPEPIERDDYPTIADITKERVRRVIAKLNNEKGEAADQDRGFRVFTLAESSFSVWEAQGPRQIGAFLEQLQLHVDNVRDDRSAEEVLFELLLKTGYPLSANVDPVDIDGKRVFSVADGAFLVCLDRGLTLELMREVAQRKPERFVVLDEGLANNDQLKANAVQIFKAAGVTFRTV